MLVQFLASLVFPHNLFMSGTKFALEGLSEAISYELEQYGIKVILIEPGVINTNFEPNIKLPNPINNKSQQTMLKEQKPATVYSNNDTKKGNFSHYSSTCGYISISLLSGYEKCSVTTRSCGSNT